MSGPTAASYGDQVRRRLSAGENRIRTIGSAGEGRDGSCVGSLSLRFFGGGEPTRVDIERLVVSRGTDGSNPASSSGESSELRSRSSGSPSARIGSGRWSASSRDGCVPNAPGCRVARKTGTSVLICARIAVVGLTVTASHFGAPTPAKLRRRARCYGPENRGSPTSCRRSSALSHAAPGSASTRKPVADSAAGSAPAAASRSRCPESWADVDTAIRALRPQAAPPEQFATRDVGLVIFNPVPSCLPASRR